MTEKMKKELKDARDLSVAKSVLSLFNDDFKNDLETFLKYHVSDDDFDDLYFAFSQSKTQGFIETFKKLKEFYSFI